MRVVETKSDLVFHVWNLINFPRQTVHAQSFVPYPVPKQAAYASQVLVRQAKHFHKINHLVEVMTGVRKHKGSYEVEIRWIIYDNDDDGTWEYLA